MLKALETYVSTQYAYAKKSDLYTTVNAYFCNAYGATCFALDLAENEEEYNAMICIWDDYKEQFENLMWGEN